MQNMSKPTPFVESGERKPTEHEITPDIGVIIPLEELKKVDLYRDTPVRFLGYANEVGESFRQIIGTKWVNVTYGIATLYVLADTAHKSAETYNINRFHDHCMKRTLFTTTDCFIWQMLASVFIPGFTINRVCATSNYFLKKSERISKGNRKLYVTAIGLATIPFIIRPIDTLVDMFLDATLRKYKV